MSLRTRIRAVAHFDWSEMGAPYAAFSTLCNAEDWCQILRCLSDALPGLSTLRTSEATTILDFGAGVGTTASSIRRRLFNHHGICSNWDLYEPDAVARTLQSTLVPTIGDTMIVRSCEGLPSKRQYAAVVFCHTSYYLADLSGTLTHVLQNQLLPGGAAIFVALSDSSPFWHRSQSMVGTAEHIEEVVTPLGVSVSKQVMRSRFTLTPDARKDEGLMQNIARFVLGDSVLARGDVGQVAERLSAPGIDFGDRLIVVRKDDSCSKMR